MENGERTTPTAFERWLEAKLPGAQFGAVLVLLFATFVFMASGWDSNASRVITVFLQGLTLLAALLAASTSRRLFRIATIVVVVALVSATIAVTVPSSDAPRDGLFLLNLLLVAGAPVAIGRALWQRRVVDVQTVLGAVCIYILIGMFYSFLYTFVGDVSTQQFFAQTASPSVADYLYFSLITLCTVGYGDFTPAHSLGRSLASSEGLVGQLYLVTIVAVVVGRMARIEPKGRSGGSADATSAVRSET